jgi:O-antigen/teichoic acid export membrane protein
VSAEPQGGYLARVRRDAVHGSLWTFLATVLAAPVGLGANVLLARALGTHGLGRFGTYTAIFAVVLAVTNLGWSEATVQWLASATAREAADERRDLIRRCAGFHVFVSGPTSAACVIWLLAGSGALVAIIAGFSIWVMQALGTSTVINTATARNALAARISIIANTAGQIALVTAALATHRASTTWAAVVVVSFLGPLLATLRLPSDERAALFAPRLVLRAPEGFWVYAFSACVGGLVATLVNGRSEVIVLRANGLLAAAGIFTVITGLAGQMATLLDSTMAPLTPIAAGLMAIDRERAVRVFKRALRITAMLGTFATCVLIPGGILMIRLLYGNAFAGAAGPFAVLALVSSLQTALGPMSAFAFATRSAAQVLKINSVCLAADAALALSLVPLIGLWGAVAANAAAQVMSLVFLTFLVSRRLKLPPTTVVRELQLFAAGLGLGALAAIASLSFHGTATIAILGVIILTLAALRVLIGCFPGMRLTADDMAIVAGAGNSRMLTLLTSLLARIGLAESPRPVDGS